MAWPNDGRLVIRSLAKDAKNLGGSVTSVSLLGSKETLAYRQSADGLEVSLPATPPCEYAFVLKITGLTWPILRECQRP